MKSSDKQILFEKFSVIECLKKSDTNAVYLTENVLLDKKVILKTMEYLHSDDESKKRFSREAKILARLDHPNIIKVLDFGKDKKSQYIVFEYFDGVSLREIIKNKSLTQHDFDFLLSQFFSGLAYLHRNEIIHRDLKPENILVAENLTLKISDFGLALAKNDDFITRTHSVIGTPCYMSPEQVSGKILTVQSDLFTAGVILFELYTGKNLFHSEVFDETIKRILNFNVEQIKADIQQLPDKFQKVIPKLLDKDLDRRYKNVTQVTDDLGIPHSQVVTEKVKSKNFLYKIAVPIVSTLAIIAFLIFLTADHLFNSPENPQSNNRIEEVKLETNVVTENINTSEEKVPPDLGINSSFTEVGAENNHPDILKVEEKVQKLTNTESVASTRELHAAESKFGLLKIDSYPWSRIYINKHEFGITPFENEIELKAGDVFVEFSNPDFPTLTKKVTIIPDTLISLNVNLRKSFGYFTCKVFPWANVFINNKYLGQTPFDKPIPVLPGKYTLTLKNPNFNEHQAEIIINAGDTLITDYTIQKFDSLQISNID